MTNALRAKDANFKYPQNAMRHCFASYHLVKHGSADKTALMLNDPNSDTLWTNYRAMVKPKDVDPYWEIVPESVKLAREANAQLKHDATEAKAKQDAEDLSNCGEAIQDESGNWIPVTKPHKVNHDNVFEVLQYEG